MTPNRMPCEPHTGGSLPNWSWDCPKARKHVIIFHHQGAEYITYVPCDREPTPDEVEILTKEFDHLVNEYWTGEAHGEDGYIDDEIIDELIYHPIDGLGIHTTTWGRTVEMEEACETVKINLDGTIIGPDNNLPRTTITL